jgi:hypothetical protein
MARAAACLPISWLPFADTWRLCFHLPVPAAQALELQQLLPNAGPAPLEQLLQPGYQAINNPGVSWAVGNSGKQLLYPEWMQGTWEVRTLGALASVCCSCTMHATTAQQLESSMRDRLRGTQGPTVRL